MIKTFLFKKKVSIQTGPVSINHLQWIESEIRIIWLKLLQEQFFFLVRLPWTRCSGVPRAEPLPLLLPKRCWHEPPQEDLQWCQQAWQQAKKGTNLPLRWWDIRFENRFQLGKYESLLAATSSSSRNTLWLLLFLFRIMMMLPLILNSYNLVGFHQNLLKFVLNLRISHCLS